MTWRVQMKSADDVPTRPKKRGAYGSLGRVFALAIGVLTPEVLTVER